MSGFLLGLGVGLFLTFISIASIWFARKTPGMVSIGVIQGGMLIKLMMGGILSMAIIKFAPVDLWAYALTVGVYVCSVMPILAYFMTSEN